MDPGALYREEVFSDRGGGTLLRLTPVDKNGAADAKRKVLYVGQAQLLTPAGTLPLSFEIDADSLEQAAQRFGEIARRALQETMDKLRELRREAGSSILIPEAGAAAGLTGGAHAAMMPPGKIKLP
ncbi:MAG: hypothetical protein KGJ55_01985 [Gammaproteobacteria bacterium]|nr:hypothetical protein [Gammaproteobacteria bacterium]